MGNNDEDEPKSRMEAFMENALADDARRNRLADRWAPILGTLTAALVIIGSIKLWGAWGLLVPAAIWAVLMQFFRLKDGHWWWPGGH